MRRAGLALTLLAACHVGETVDPAVDAAPGAVDAGAVEPDGAAAPESSPALYPTDRTLSPITPHVAGHLRDIAAISAVWRDDVFAKVGASSTVSVHFMQCFAGSNVELDGRDELAPTIEYFKFGDAAGTDPYRRESLAATIGWSSGAALAGDPSPLEQEVAAIMPRFAVIMFGTNDVELGDIFRYGNNMLTITDNLTAQGIIPVLTSFMPRDDDPAADLWVPRYNAVVRGVAQARQVPFVDLHRELLPLPGHGLGGDDIHMNVFLLDGLARSCWFTPEALQFGNNVRNLLTIQTLHRLREVVIESAPAPDPAGPGQRGAGSPADPFAIDGLPFTDLRDTTASPHDRIDGYPACAAPQDESGPELYYRLEVAQPTSIRAMVFDRGEVDVDVHLLRDTPDAASCVARDHQMLVADLEPGTYWFALDTFVSAGAEKGGEYLFVVVAD